MAPTEWSLSRGEKEEAMAEALIRRRVEDAATAISSKNIEAVMSLYAPEVVSFDLTPPLRYAGAAGRRPSSAVADR
jgi:ketosteroid isomerase-like protein